MASASELSKLRKVLDYVPYRQMSGWAGRSYFDALTRRLNREVLVERAGTVKPARDEAVLVVAPEEWEAAQRARQQQVVQEAELEQAREDLAAVSERSEHLESEIEALRAQLADLETTREEKRKYALQLVGVRKPAGQVVPVHPGPADAEPAAGESWAPVEQEPAEQEPAEPAPAAADDLAAQGWEVLPDEPGPGAESPEAAEEARRATEEEIRATDEAISRVETEIERIERELRSLADKERELRDRGDQVPYEHGDYTLYHRRVGQGTAQRDFFFFSKTPPDEGEPAPVPAGFEVAVHPRTGMPYLRKHEPKVAARKPAKRAAAKKRPARRAGAKKKTGKRRT